jgi:hypothetical protein
MMMGVPIDGATYTYGDNYSVVKIASVPDSVIQKKPNAIEYHAVQKTVAMK